MKPPHSPEAERSVVAQILKRPGGVTEVVGTLLEPSHFHDVGMRTLYGEIVSAHYADEPIDPLSIASQCEKTLARLWRVDEAEVAPRVAALAAQEYAGAPTAHAKIVKRDADYRALLDLAALVTAQVGAEKEGPEELAGALSHEAMRIATDTLLTQELLTFEQVGRRFVQAQRTAMAARAAGVPLGAYFDLSFLDSYMRGLRPSETFVLAGDPGAGKSAIAWKAGLNFAEKQMQQPKEERIGTLVLSLEMSEEPSSNRTASMVSGVDGGTLREGKTDDDQLAKIIAEWGRRKEIPMVFNYASTMRSSQLRAIVVEAIRKYNVGLVIIDHFRYVDMEGRFDSVIDREEELMKFLKQDVATQLNVAVIVLAHTTKATNRDDGRPALANLRGGQLVSGHSDYVAFVYRPYEHASQDQIDAGTVSRTDAEMIWGKNRHGLTSTARFMFDPSTMFIK